MLTNLTLTKPDSPFRGGGGGFASGPTYYTYWTGFFQNTHTNTLYSKEVITEGKRQK